VTTLGIILKHAKSGYLVAVGATLPLLLALSFSALVEQGKRLRMICMGVSIAFLIGFGLNRVSALKSNQVFIETINANEQALQRQIDILASERNQQPEEIVILRGFGAYSRCFSLQFGDWLAGDNFRREIKQLCPGDLVFDVWGQRIRTAKGNFKLDEGVEWDILVMGKRYLPEVAHYGRVVEPGWGIVFLIAQDDSEK